MNFDPFDDPLFEAIQDAQDAAGREPVPGTLHGVSDVTSPDVIWWAPDCIAMEAVRAAGYPQTVALVPTRDADIFAPLKSHEAQIAAWQKIVITGGRREFVEELARRLGRHRVWRCTWREGCSDAADTLQLYGIQALRDAIEAATPYPIEGIHYTSAEAMLAHRHAPPPPTLTTGCNATDLAFRFPGEGKLIVITGVPNHGKSTWVTFIMAHTAVHHHRRWTVFSPEMGEWQNLAAQVMGLRVGKPFRPLLGCDNMTDAEISEGADWCRPRFSFLACDSEVDAPTLDWLLDRARACVLRDGATDFVIDPWNEIEHDDAGRNETTYIGRALQRLRAFAGRHGCNVWIVAHPTKLKPFKIGDPVPVPTAYDINGGANWANKADFILTVHCPDTVTQVHLLKARFRRWGRRGAVAELEFDPTTGGFRSAALADALADN